MRNLKLKSWSYLFTSEYELWIVEVYEIWKCCCQWRIKMSFFLWYFETSKIDQAVKSVGNYIKLSKFKIVIRNHCWIVVNTHIRKSIVLATAIFKKYRRVLGGNRSITLSCSQTVQSGPDFCWTDRQILSDRKKFHEKYFNA